MYHTKGFVRELGLIHGNLLQIVFATIVGLLFGIIYVKNKNIAYTIIMHFCNNIFVFLINLLFYKFSSTLLFNASIVLNIVISFSLLHYLNKKYGFSIVRLW